MLPKKNRLTRRESEALVKSGISLSSSLFSLRAKQEEGQTKCSVAVSKKVSKKAVERNRIRRRVYAACREAREHFPEGTHALIFARSGAKDATIEDIQGDLAALAARATEKL